MPTPFCYTIGHSNHAPEKFADLLARHGVNCVADVRSSPYSRHAPQFNRENVERFLKGRGVAYVFLGAELGAMRRDPDLLFPDGGLDYEKVRETPSFKRGIERLLEGMRKGFIIALMCAEKEPLDCHRFVLVTRALRLKGVEVRHILENGDAADTGELEGKLVTQLRPDAGQPSLFEAPGGAAGPEEAALALAYRERNRKISRPSKKESAAPEDGEPT